MMRNYLVLPILDGDLGSDLSICRQLRMMDQVLTNLLANAFVGSRPVNCT